MDIGASANTVGTLLLEEGGTVSVFGTDVAIGATTDLPGCEINIRDPGSVLFANRDIIVGGTSLGTLNIENDANALALGEILVRPMSTVNVQGMITQGLTGDSMMLEGELNLTNEGHVNIANTLDIAATGTVTTAGTGIPRVEADVIQNSGNIAMTVDSDLVGEVHNNGIIESSGIAFNFFFEDLINSGDINTSIAARIGLFGATSGSGTFTGNGIVEFQGPVRPGAGLGTNIPGSMAIDGSVVMGVDSVLEIDLGGVDGAQFDRVSTGNDLEISGGGLSVVSLGSFTPSMGDEFLIVETDGGLSGVFNGLPQGALVTNLNGQDLFIDYTAGDGNDIALTTTSVGGVLLGDVNLDREVNLLDVAPFVDRVASATFQAEADINQDGAVNLLDVTPFINILAGG